MAERDLGSEGWAIARLVEGEDFFIRAKPQVMRFDEKTPCSVSVEAYQVVGEDDGGKLLEGTEASGAIVPVESCDAADVLLKGSIKWDGCSNLDIGYQHFCSRREAVSIGTLMDALYTAASELMGGLWDE